MITVSHLSKVYGELKAVDDFSFTVEPGEIVGLIGPNGAGQDVDAAVHRRHSHA